MRILTCVIYIHGKPSTEVAPANAPPYTTVFHVRINNIFLASTDSRSNIGLGFFVVLRKYVSMFQQQKMKEVFSSTRFETVHQV